MLKGVPPAEEQNGTECNKILKDVDLASALLRGGNNACVFPFVIYARGL